VGVRCQARRNSLYFFYVDESGNRDPEVEKILPDGTRIPKDWLYVLTGVGFFEHRWKKFFRYIVTAKRALIQAIQQRHPEIRLELADCEIKSNWVRIPGERQRHKFLSRLTQSELRDLIDKYYNQLSYHHMVIITVIVDKRELEPYMDRDKLHRKAWELLCERIENYMAEYHRKHLATVVTDDMSLQENRSVAMKHAYFLERGTTSGLYLNHLVEMPLFVRSELTEGIQLADLCSYNFYRAFKTNDLNYPFFRRILPRVYVSQNTEPDKIDGIKIFPDNSNLIPLLSQM
jgi:hypothetical protein